MSVRGGDHAVVIKRPVSVAQRRLMEILAELTMWRGRYRSSYAAGMRARQLCVGPRMVAND
jgi:hypothetical protein